MSENKKVIRDGKVAVLVSRGFGAGWFSWNTGLENRERLLFDPEIVAAVESDDSDRAAEVATAMFAPEYVCVLGADGLRIEWVDVGERFRVNEYDGAESLVLLGSEEMFTA